MSETITQYDPANNAVVKDENYPDLMKIFSEADQEIIVLTNCPRESPDYDRVTTAAQVQSSKKLHEVEPGIVKYEYFAATLRKFVDGEGDTIERVNVTMFTPHTGEAHLVTNQFAVSTIEQVIFLKGWSTWSPYAAFEIQPKLGKSGQNYNILVPVAAEEN
jgi:hypothetical protein